MREFFDKIKVAERTRKQSLECSSMFTEMIAELKKDFATLPSASPPVCALQLL